MVSSLKVSAGRLQPSLWPPGGRLKRFDSSPRTPGEEDGIAVGLAACATQTQLDDLIGFLDVESAASVDPLPCRRSSDSAESAIVNYLRRCPTTLRSAARRLPCWRVEQKRTTSPLGWASRPIPGERRIVGERPLI